MTDEDKIIKVLRDSNELHLQRGRLEGLSAACKLIPWICGSDADIEDLRKWTLNLFEEEVKRLGLPEDCGIMASVKFYREETIYCARCGKVVHGMGGMQVTGQLVEGGPVVEAQPLCEECTTTVRKRLKPHREEDDG
jgi:hypothetical protein